MLTWIDNHCHIPPGTDGDVWVEAARAAGVDEMITVGVTRERSVEAVAVAARHDNVFATVGVHPHDAKDGMDGIAELIGEPKVVAIGEAGLDYHYDHSPRDTQREVFAQHISLAHEHDLPLVIHTRDAWADTFDILDAEGTPRRTVFHCFTGGPDEAKQGLERGRGKKNQPANVVHVGEAVADLHGVDAEIVAHSTTAKARAFYGLADV